MFGKKYENDLISLLETLKDTPESKRVTYLSIYGLRFQLVSMNSTACKGQPRSRFVGLLIKTWQADCDHGWMSRDHWLIFIPMVLYVTMCVFWVMDTVRLQVVWGNLGAQTCSFTGKLQLTDDWLKPWKGPCDSEGHNRFRVSWQLLHPFWGLVSIPQPGFYCATPLLYYQVSYDVEIWIGGQAV